jgi:glycine cleavage system aminomethyltransferase T
MMCCAFTQLVRPGAPFTLGSFLSSMSLKSGAPTFGMPEPVMSNFIITQLARRLGVPLRCGGALTASKIAEAIEEAGADLGLRWYGARALMSLRLEKAWGAWTLDYRPDFSAAESGLDAFIHWHKDFVGKQAALAESATGAKKKLVTMVVDSDDIDVCNDEAIIKDGEAIGYVSSGGYAHHVGKSVALGYVPAALAKAGTQVEVEIMGERYGAEILDKPLYDADGGRMRSPMSRGHRCVQSTIG